MPGDGATPRRVTVVRLPAPLRPLAQGAAEVDVRGGTVGEVLRGLVERHPGLERHIWTESGRLREHVNVFLGEEDVRHLGGLVAATDGQDVTILPSIAGG